MTTSGMEDIQSEVWQFKIVDPSSGAGKNLTGNIQQILQDLFGPNASQILNELSGYTVNAIRYNGTEITSQELLQIIDGLQNQNFEITDLTIQ